MSFTSIYGIALPGLEEFSDDEYVADGDDVIEEVAGEEDTTLALSNEVTEIGEADVEDQAIGMVSEEVASLENLETILRASLENNRPLDIYSAAMVGNHLASISSKTKLQFPTFSNESFDTEEAAMQATRDSLESIGSAISSAWKWLVEAIRKAVSTVKGWFSSTTIAYKRIEAQARKLREAIAGEKDGFWKRVGDKLGFKATLEGFGDRTYLTVNGGIISEGQFQSALKLSEQGTKLARNKAVSDIYTKAIEELGDDKMTVAKRDTLIKNLQDGVDKAIKDAGWTESGGWYSMPKSVPGPRVTIHLNMRDNKLSEKVVPVKSDENMKVKAYNYKELDKHLTAIIDSISEASSSFAKNISTNFESALSRIKISKAGGMVRTSEDDSGITVAEMRKGQQALILTNRMYNRMSQATGRNHYQMCRAGIKWASKSIDLYKKVAKEAA